jgi:hypothetical protein
MCFCLPYAINGFLGDIGPRRYPVVGGLPSTWDGTAVSYSYDSYFGGGYQFTASNEYYQLDTGGLGILATLTNSSYFLWVSGCTSGTRDGNGNISYSERPDSTSIWKFYTHGNQSPFDKFGIVHRDNGSVLTSQTTSDSNTDIEDGGLHMVGITKSGQSCRLFKDGVFTNAFSLAGDDDLTVGDPYIGWDLNDTVTTNTRFRDKMHMQTAWGRTLSDEEVMLLWQPATRFDFLREVNKTIYLPTSILDYRQSMMTMTGY